ncbi:MAG: (2Fe-2S) ferredoxin domain-containing protein [Bdellovibrionaceae bacterium]|nr:(2Fe-2S) ferredoxin domain-containing protein [Pseudobdellovibrionaceae bacterium]
MKTEKLFWTEYGIFICTKCQKSITAPVEKSATEFDGGTDIAEAIKNKFKSTLNEMGYKGRVRVMTSSCLGVCPTGYQAISQISATDPSLSKSYVFNPHQETSQVFEEIKKTLT